MQNSTYNTVAANRRGVSGRYWHSSRNARMKIYIFHLSQKGPEETANSVYLRGNGLRVQVWKTTWTFVFYLPEYLNICPMSIYYF